MGEAEQIVAQVNKELIDLSKKSRKSSNDSDNKIADKEEDAGAGGDDDAERGIEAGADEDESDEGADDGSEEEDAEEDEEGEDKDTEDSDEAEEGGGAEDDEHEKGLPKSKIKKGKSKVRVKNTPPMKKGRGGKGSGDKERGEKGNAPVIAGGSGKAVQKSPVARKRKVSESVPESKADKKQGRKVLKKSA